jgi:endonuclease/exonuclease/phosphatase family metal-dependent hydrolase
MIRLASYNIQYGKGKDGRFDLERIAGEIRGADLIALQEVETFAERSEMLDQVNGLADLLAPLHWVFGPGLDLDAATPENPGRRRRYGNMVLSRWPILSATNHMLPKVGLADQFSQRRALLETVIAVEGRPIRFMSVHFDHVGPDTRLPQIDAALRIIADGVAEGGAVSGLPVPGLPAVPMPRETVLMGDFNFTPHCIEYEHMLGRTVGRHGRLIREAGLADAWTACGNGEFEGVSFPGGEPKRIDHCFLTPSLRPALRRMWIDVAAQGSDHQQIFVEMDLAALA